jgi:multidrug transporter EmrE-like cation transporter
VLGIAIIGLELGFLLAYRAGWNISLAGLVSNVIVGLVLLPVGLLLFQEKLTPLNLAGVVVCIAGLVMINWR